MRKKQTKKRNHTGSFVLGFILLAFAVFGIFEAVSLTVQKVSEAREGSSKFVEYEQFLEPFVVIDPTPFDDISGAEPTDLLDAAISAMIYDGETMNTYDVFEGEVTGLLVPQGDVEAYFVRYGNPNDAQQCVRLVLQRRVQLRKESVYHPHHKR